MSRKACKLFYLNHWTKSFYCDHFPKKTIHRLNLILWSSQRKVLSPSKYDVFVLFEWNCLILVVDPSLVPVVKRVPGVGDGPLLLPHVEDAAGLHPVPGCRWDLRYFRPTCISLRILVQSDIYIRKCWRAPRVGAEERSSLLYHFIKRKRFKSSRPSF